MIQGVIDMVPQTQYQKWLVYKPHMTRILGLSLPSNILRRPLPIQNARVNGKKISFHKSTDLLGSEHIRLLNCDNLANIYMYLKLH